MIGDHWGQSASNNEPYKYDYNAQYLSNPPHQYHQLAMSRNYYQQQSTYHHNSIPLSRRLSFTQNEHSISPFASRSHSPEGTISFNSQEHTEISCSLEEIASDPQILQERGREDVIDIQGVTNLPTSPVSASRSKRNRSKSNDDHPGISANHSISPENIRVPSIYSSEYPLNEFTMPKKRARMYDPDVATMPDYGYGGYVDRRYNTPRYYGSQHAYHHPYQYPTYGAIHPSNSPEDEDEILNYTESDEDSKKPSVNRKTEDRGRNLEELEGYKAIQLFPSQSEFEKAGTPRAMNALKVWYQRFHELIEFQRFYGHCNVRQKYKPNPALGIWVNKQRCSRNNLTAEKRAALESINFDWGTKKGEFAWNLKFEKLFGNTCGLIHLLNI